LWFLAIMTSRFDLAKDIVWESEPPASQIDRSFCGVYRL
jgi:hypothetical protein